MYCIHINVPTWRLDKQRSDDRLHDKCNDRERRYRSDNGENRKSKITISTTSNVTAGTILPGASTLEDINMYINAAKKLKIDQLKKKIHPNANKK